MMHLAKSTKDFELFERRNPGTVRVSTEHSKDKVIVVRCAMFRQNSQNAHDGTIFHHPARFGS